MSAVPVDKPLVVTRPQPQLRVEVGVKPGTRSLVLRRAMLFGVLALSTFMASSLGGMVMVEKARREGIHAVDRAKSAAKDEAILRDRVQTMTGPAAVDSWAEQHGFVAPEALSLPDNEGQ